MSEDKKVTIGENGVGAEARKVPGRPSVSPLGAPSENSFPTWTPPEFPPVNASSRSTIVGNQEVAKPPAPTWVPSAETSFVRQHPQRETLTKSHLLSPRNAVMVQELQECCRQLCLPLFYQEQARVHSLGFTSALAGEGKTFLSIVTAGVLANDLGCPVTLIECNWEHPSFDQQFGLSPIPGLAEWLRGECSEKATRRQISHNLAIVPAGNGKLEAIKLLHQMLHKGLHALQLHPDELFVVDLPSITTNAYGSLAANMVESLIVVVHAQVTPETIVAKTCEQLKDLPLHGIVLNQMKSRIPHWLRQIL